MVLTFALQVAAGSHNLPQPPMRAEDSSRGCRNTEVEALALGGLSVRATALTDSLARDFHVHATPSRGWSG
jgi:hypothetical protein